MAKKYSAPFEGVDFEQLQERIFRRIHRTGEEVKNDLPNALRMAIETKAWAHFISPETGKPFESLQEWLHHDLPQGVAMGMGRHAITYRDAMELCREVAPDVHHVLKENAPKRRNRKTRVDEDAAVACRAVTRERATRSGLSERLQSDYPKIWRKYLAGQYRSVRAAAEAAGIVKPSHDPLMRLKSYWRKADPKARRAFLAWLEEAKSRTSIK